MDVVIRMVIGALPLFAGSQEGVMSFGEAIKAHLTVSERDGSGISSVLMPAPLRYFWVNGNKPTEILYPDLLKNKVTLRNGKEALSYVRLFSAPSNATLVTNRMGIELRSWEDIDSDWLPELGADLKSRLLHGKWADGLYGICSSPTLMRQVKASSSVSKNRFGEYIIQRIVMKQEVGRIEWKVFKVTESVSRSGHYKLVKQAPFATHKSKGALFHTVH